MNKLMAIAKHFGVALHEIKRISNNLYEFNWECYLVVTDSEAETAYDSAIRDKYYERAENEMSLSFSDYVVLTKGIFSRKDILSDTGIEIIIQGEPKLFIY